MKIEICLHDLPIKTKEEANSFVGKITNEISHCDKTLEFTEFMDAVGSGQTWTGGIFKPKVKKASNWIRQQVYAIDVDNNLGKIMVPDVLIDHYIEKECPPNGMYYSLSSKKDKPKYRLIWVLEKPITDPNIAKNFKRWLILNSLGKADSCTINLDRLYFGGKDSSIIFDLPYLIDELPQAEKKSKKFKERTGKVANRILDKGEFFNSLNHAKKHMANPELKYLTRYKTVFNCAVYIAKASNSVWDGEKIFNFLKGIMDKHPDVWKDYHHGDDDVYSWCERAYEWTLREIM